MERKERKELYLKTMFCCLACDGDIAPIEEETMKRVANRYPHLFEDVEVESYLDNYKSLADKDKRSFPIEYLRNLSGAGLSAEEEMTIVDFAIEIIEADKVIKYSEVKFFKKIRARLSHLSDEDILERYPDKEFFLQPDIHVNEDPDWSDFTCFNVRI